MQMDDLDRKAAAHFEGYVVPHPGPRRRRHQGGVRPAQPGQSVP
jgi:hypothetical protein